jgi:hypothetical protein
VHPRIFSNESCSTQSGTSKDMDVGSQESTQSMEGTVCVMQAAMLIRIAVTHEDRKEIARQAGAIQPLVSVLHHGGKHPITLVAIEALACLLTQDTASRVRI